MEQLEIDSDHVKLSLKQELVNVYNKHKFPLTVEPLVFLASLAFGLNEVTSETIALDKLSIYQVIRSSLLTQKICQNKLNFSEEVCGNLTQLEDTRHEVQRHVTDYEALYNTCSIVPR